MSGVATSDFCGLVCRCLLNHPLRVGRATLDTAHRRSFLVGVQNRLLLLWVYFSFWCDSRLLRPYERHLYICLSLAP